MVLRRPMRTTLFALTCFLAACGAGPKGATGPTGPTGPAGMTGPKGMDGEDFNAPPSISLVTPNKIIVGGTTEVAISGFNTKWMGTPAVTFGDGVTVSNVRVASATAIVVDVSVDTTATPGTRDVKVTQNGNVATYTGVFAVQPVYSVTLPAKSTMGAVFAVRIHHNDPHFAFSSNPTVTISPNPMDQITAFTSRPTPQDLVLQFYADLTAAVGKRAVTVTSDDLTIGIADAFDLGLATETTLAEGTPATGTLTEPYSGVFFKVTTNNDLKVFAMNVAMGKPTVMLIGSTGKYTDLIKSGSAVLDVCPAAGCYLSAFDSSGKANLAYSVSVAPPPGAAEAEPNDSLGAPQAITLAQLGNTQQAYVTGGQLSAVADQDWFKVTVGAAEVGKIFHLTTSPGDAYCDPVVDVQTAMGLSLGGPSDDSGYHEDFKSTPIPAAGDYFVKVSNSTYVSTFNASSSHYTLAIVVE